MLPSGFSVLHDTHYDQLFLQPQLNWFFGLSIYLRCDSQGEHYTGQYGDTCYVMWIPCHYSTAHAQTADAAEASRCVSLQPYIRLPAAKRICIGRVVLDGSLANHKERGKWHEISKFLCQIHIQPRTCCMFLESRWTGHLSRYVPEHAGLPCSTDAVVRYTIRTQLAVQAYRQLVVQSYRKLVVQACWQLVAQAHWQLVAQNY
jgi:hypothetical protein